MADLDDFFAKKDKKKSKGKPKFVLTPDEVVKNLEDTSKREAAAAKSKKPEPIAASTTVTNTSGATAIEEEKIQPVVEKQTTEEEWKEFEEEKRKDYSGLKIGQLAINDEEEASPSDGEDEDGESEGGTQNAESSNRRTGGGSGYPWKKVIPAEQVTQIPMDMVNTSSKYVAPAFKHAMQQGSASVPRRLRTAPDITNADFFPTLGAAQDKEQRKKKNEPAFEEVRHGGRIQRIKEPSASTPAAATNRFQSLDEEDS